LEVLVRPEQEALEHFGNSLVLMEVHVVYRDESVSVHEVE
jgi:hypothetical protein